MILFLIFLTLGCAGYKTNLGSSLKYIVASGDVRELKSGKTYTESMRITPVGTNGVNHFTLYDSGGTATFLKNKVDLSVSGNYAIVHEYGGPSGEILTRIYNISMDVDEESIRHGFTIADGEEVADNRHLLNTHQNQQSGMQSLTKNYPKDSVITLKASSAKVQSYFAILDNGFIKRVVKFTDSYQLTFNRIGVWRVRVLANPVFGSSFDETTTSSVENAGLIEVFSGTFVIDEFEVSSGWNKKVYESYQIENTIVKGDLIEPEYITFYDEDAPVNDKEQIYEVYRSSQPLVVELVHPTSDDVVNFSLYKSSNTPLYGDLIGNYLVQSPLSSVEWPGNTPIYLGHSFNLVNNSSLIMFESKPIRIIRSEPTKICGEFGSDIIGLESGKVTKLPGLDKLLMSGLHKVTSLKLEEKTNGVWSVVLEKKAGDMSATTGTGFYTKNFKDEAVGEQITFSNNVTYRLTIAEQFAYKQGRSSFTPSIDVVDNAISYDFIIDSNLGTTKFEADIDNQTVVLHSGQTWFEDAEITLTAPAGAVAKLIFNNVSYTISGNTFKLSDILPGSVLIEQEMLPQGSYQLVVEKGIDQILSVELDVRHLPERPKVVIYGHDIDSDTSTSSELTYNVNASKYDVPSPVVNPHIRAYIDASLFYKYKLDRLENDVWIEVATEKDITLGEDLASDVGLDGFYQLIITDNAGRSNNYYFISMGREDLIKLTVDGLDVSMGAWNERKSITVLDDLTANFTEVDSSSRAMSVSSVSVKQISGNDWKNPGSVVGAISAINTFYNFPLSTNYNSATAKILDAGADQGAFIATYDKEFDTTGLVGEFNFQSTTLTVNKAIRIFVNKRSATKYFEFGYVENNGFIVTNKLDYNKPNRDYRLRYSDEYFNANFGSSLKIFKGDLTAAPTSGVETYNVTLGRNFPSATAFTEYIDSDLQQALLGFGDTLDNEFAVPFKTTIYSRVMCTIMVLGLAGAGDNYYIPLEIVPVNLFDAKDETSNNPVLQSSVREKIYSILQGNNVALPLDSVKEFNKDVTISFDGSVIPLSIMPQQFTYQLSISYGNQSHIADIMRDSKFKYEIKVDKGSDVDARIILHAYYNGNKIEDNDNRIEWNIRINKKLTHIGGVNFIYDGASTSPINHILQATSFKLNHLPDDASVNTYVKVFLLNNTGVYVEQTGTFTVGPKSNIKVRVGFNGGHYEEQVFIINK